MSNNSNYDEKFNHLIPEMQVSLTNFYLNTLLKKERFEVDKTLDTSPFLNLTLSVYMSSLINLLDIIKSRTVGEIKLIENIELIKNNILNSIKDLPFMKSIEHY